jgi:plastocyanin
MNIMKTKILLSILLMVLALSGYSKTLTITASGFQFTPASITINIGDTVNFNIGSSHNAVEISKATYDANGTTPLPGFSEPFGGGKVLPDQLTVGTHYYVCTPHASYGMKGTIVVQNTTGVAEFQQKPEISVYPNPSNGMFHLAINGLQDTKRYNLEVLNLLGEKVYASGFASDHSDIDLSNSSNGIYFIKFTDGQNMITKRVIKN